MQVFFLGNQSKEENIAYFEGIADVCRQQLAALPDIDQSIGYFEGELGPQDQSPLLENDRRLWPKKPATAH